MLEQKDLGLVWRFLVVMGSFAKNLVEPGQRHCQRVGYDMRGSDADFPVACSPVSRPRIQRGSSLNDGMKKFLGSVFHIPAGMLDVFRCARLMMPAELEPLNTA